jgi:putative thioredoxin
MGTMTVIDVNEATFQQEVIDRSHDTTVVVDFWAEWCGPCRQLTPALEKAANAREGDVVLAKLDTDANQGLASTYGIQGIPAVKAFKDGKVVDEFVGALPPAQVERFLDRIVPSEADALIASGSQEDLKRALQLEPGRADAAVPYAQMLAAAGDREGALEVLSNVAGSFAADGLAERLRLSDDPELEAAFALLDKGETEAALDALIDAIAAGDADRKEELRRVVVGVLDSLGVAHPLARDARRKLATALY